MDRAIRGKRAFLSRAPYDVEIRRLADGLGHHGGNEYAAVRAILATGRVIHFDHALFSEIGNEAGAG